MRLPLRLRLPVSCQRILLLRKTADMSCSVALYVLLIGMQPAGRLPRYRHGSQCSGGRVPLPMLWYLLLLLRNALLDGTVAILAILSRQLANPLGSACKSHAVAWWLHLCY